jgi:hypothetical protein
MKLRTCPTGAAEVEQAHPLHWKQWKQPRVEAEISGIVRAVPQSTW